MFVPSGSYLIGVGSKIRMSFFFSYFTNKAYFHNCLWLTFKPSPTLFSVGCFFGRQTSRCETTCLTWSNMERIYSRSVLWYLFLLRRLILALDFPYRVKWILSSSSAPSDEICYSPLISMIHTFCLACVRSWWEAGEFGIVSVI